MAAPAAYSDLMKNSSSLHLHEGFMAVAVYSKPRQSGARGVKEMARRNEGGGKKLSSHVSESGRASAGLRPQGGGEELSTDTLSDVFPPPFPSAHTLPRMSRLIKKRGFEDMGLTSCSTYLLSPHDFLAVWL